MSVILHYDVIGKNIREQRRRLHLTQEVLAEYAGISQQFLSYLERGKAIPSLETILSLCDAMQISPNTLLLGSATHNDNPPCRLRSECAGYEDSLSDLFFPSKEDVFRIINPSDHPLLDFIFADGNDAEDEDQEDT